MTARPSRQWAPKALQAAKEYLDKNPQYRILVEGHCDWHGTSRSTTWRWETTARPSRRSALIQIGVPADKNETLSKGSEEAKKNADDATAAKDRRDELVVLKKS